MNQQKYRNYSAKIRVFTGILSFFLLLALLTGGFAACTGLPKAGGPGQPSDPVPFLEKCRTGTLPNGLTYYLLENAKPENRAYLTLAVNAGSVLEADDEQGLAHFVEHMAFNGTARFPESELIDYLRSLGMRFGADVNAYTTYDNTVYGIEVPVETGTRSIPGKALEILDDWTHAVTFDEKDVDDERLVIMEEYRARLGARERARRATLPLLFQGSPYADRFPIGLPEIIQNAPASRLEGFYKTWYRPENMALIIVGDFDSAALEVSLEDYFYHADSDIKGGPEAVKSLSSFHRPEYDLPPPKKGSFQTLLVTDPELSSTQVNIYYKRAPEAIRGDLSYFRGEIIDILIDRMLSLRFDDAAAKPETPYIYAASGSVPFGKSSRYYALIAEAKTGGAESCLRELLREKEALTRYGFTEGEISIAKGSLISDYERMASEKDRQESARYVMYLTNYFFEGGNLADIEWELETVKKLLPGIGAAEIAAAAKNYFKPGDIRVFITAPEAEKDSLPSAGQIQQILKESARIKIPRPAAANVGNELLDYIPEPGEILSESTDSKTGAVFWELSNGAKVILKKTKNRNNEIVLQAMARGGTTGAANEEHISANLAAEMIDVSGLGRYTKPEINRILADKQINLYFWTSNFLRGFRGAATSGDLKTFFEVLYLCFTQPRIDPDAVEALMDQYRTSLAQRNENPDRVFSDEITRLIYGNTAHFKLLEPSDLAQANIEQALDFVRRGLNPADYTFIFTGSLDMQAIRNFTETYLASIPGGETWNTWTDLKIDRPGKTEKLVYKGKENRSLVFMGWYETFPYSEEASAAASVLTEYLDIKMTEEIREKLGGVYSVSVGVSASPIPEGESSRQIYYPYNPGRLRETAPVLPVPATTVASSGGELIMNVYFVCDPLRARELSAAVTAMLEGIARGGIDGDTFKKSVEALKKEWETSIQQNDYIARSYANSAVLLNLPLSRLDQRPHLYDQVKQTDIQNLARRLLPRGPALLILYPEGMAGN
ncbi:MAG: insulinase family protein [Treponema sp.]|jgi:zinc protease|nr:insulinase family protein [Treponema sp.]